MSDEQTSQQGETQQTTKEAWHEVGKQFQALGENLAAAFRATWEDKETRQHLEEMRDGLEGMVQEISQAIKKGATSPEAQKAREEAKKAAESIRSAGEQTLHEARPHLLSALNQINDELQKMIGKLEQQEETQAGASADATEE
jgi:NTP pyrophosphatase (non-canonical NTP hydrolase)